MRWLLWLGGAATVAGLWLLFRSVDLATATTDDLALYGGAALFLGGMILMGWGIGAGEDVGT